MLGHVRLGQPQGAHEVAHGGRPLEKEVIQEAAPRGVGDDRETIQVVMLRISYITVQQQNSGERQRERISTVFPEAFPEARALRESRRNSSRGRRVLSEEVTQRSGGLAGRPR